MTDITAYDADLLVGLMRTMLLVRRFEDKIVEVYSAQDMKTPVHLCIGQEAVAAGVCAHLRPDDYLLTTHRGHGHCLAKGADPHALYAEFYGRATGCCRGKGGSMHPAIPELGILGTSAIVGGSIPIGTGAALAAKLRGEDRVSATFFGDGASEEGSFHESLNYAALMQLPVVFVCENNGWAVNTPRSLRQPHPPVHKHAAGYGIPGVEVDGNDVLAVYGAARQAVARARVGDGPTLIECHTYRWKEHAGPLCDHERGCRPKEELDEWMARCPVQAFRRRLEAAGLIEADWFEVEQARVDADMDAAIARAKADPFPPLAELTEHVYFKERG